MKMLIYLLSVILVINLVYCMSEKQIKSTIKLVRNSCIAKTKVSEDLIEKMHKGVWEEDQPTKCYMHCCLDNFKLVNKKGQVELEDALKLIGQLPEPRREPTEKALRACADSGAASSEKCDAAWQLAKCVYFHDPDNYFLP